MTNSSVAAAALFEGKDPVVLAIYQRVIEVLATIGPCTEEIKKTSVHLVKNTGFAGVHPRKSYLYLNVRMNRPLAGSRVAKSEQVSKSRYHNEIKLTTPDEIDAELIAWLTEAYALS